MQQHDDERSKLLTNKQTTAKRLPRPSPGAARRPARAGRTPPFRRELVVGVVALNGSSPTTATKHNVETHVRLYQDVRHVYGHTRTHTRARTHTCKHKMQKTDELRQRTKRRHQFTREHESIRSENRYVGCAGPCTDRCHRQMHRPGRLIPRSKATPAELNVQWR